MITKLATKHGEILLPVFFPTVGYPGGRGEYDYFFKNLEYFCNKINHYHFLFNFSSFIFGFTIPSKDFNPQFDEFKNKDIRDILNQNTEISTSIAKKMIILLDIGGNRIFNKIIFDRLNPVILNSYEKYLNAYKDFIRSGNPDIFVNFDIGPSYTTKNEISKQGVRIWNKLSKQEKYQINHELLKVSIEFKNDDDLIMVPINATDLLLFKDSLNYLYDNYEKDIDIIGIAGIANSNVSHLTNTLKFFYEYKKEKKWKVLSHGLGLGGWQNIPILIKYEIDSCDVATPWRRACTDAISHPYFPLLVANLDFTDISQAFNHTELYNEIYSKMDCKCPFCIDLPLKEIRLRCKKADKNYTGKALHDDDFREMRIRVYFHNVFQHIALLKKLFIYKSQFNDDFMTEFIKGMPSGKTKKIFATISEKCSL